MADTTYRSSANMGDMNFYPHPMSDLSTTYMPWTVKAMFRWCQIVYSSNPVIAPALRKKAAYVVTDPIYIHKTGDERIEKQWKELFNETLKIKKLLKKIYYNIEVYGQAFVSLLFPFDRWLTCKTCGTSVNISQGEGEWYFQNYRWMNRCIKCQGITEHKSTMRFVPQVRRISLRIWQPAEITIRMNPISARKEYVWNPSRMLKEKLEATDKVDEIFLSDTPDEVIEAIQSDKAIVLDRDNTYAFFADGPSHDDDAYALPPFLSLFKPTWLWMTYNRANEAIAAGHVLPFTVLTPLQAASGHSPHTNYSMQTWLYYMQSMIQMWHRDQNSIHYSPIPVQQLTIRGDAQILGVERQLQFLRETMTACLDLPAQLLTGDMQYSGASINLRVLENLFLSVINDFDDFLNRFLVGKISSQFDMPEIEVQHRDFKMADDPQQKQIALNLRGSELISDQQVTKDLGYDWDEQKTIKEKERDEKLRLLKEQQLSSAEIQMEVQKKMAEANGEARVTSAIYEALAQLAAQKLTGNAATSDTALSKMIKDILDRSKIAPMVIADTTTQYNSYLREAEIHRFLKETPDSLKDMKLKLLESTNPDLVKDIRRKEMEFAQQAREFQASAAVQKPGRNSSDGLTASEG